MNIPYKSDFIPIPDHISDERSYRIHRDFCGFYDSCIRAIAESQSDTNRDKPENCIRKQRRKGCKWYGCSISTPDGYTR